MTSHSSPAACALAYVAVAGAVKTVTADVELAVVFHRHAVQVRLFRHRLVESGIKHRHVRRAGHYLFAGFDPHQVGGVMQRSQRDVVANRVLDFLVYFYAGGKALAAVQHAMAHRADFVHIFHRALIRVGQRLQHPVDTVGVRFHGGVGVKNFTVHLLADMAALDADAFHQPFGQQLFAVHVDQLVFQGGRARVENQNFHRYKLLMPVLSRR